MRLRFLQSFFPSISCEDRDRHDNSSTHSTERAKYRNDNFLRDHITIKTHTHNRHDRDDLHFRQGFTDISRKRKSKKYGIDDHRYHREGNTEDKGASVREDTRTRKWLRKIARKWTKSFGIISKPECVCMIGEITCIEKSDDTEHEDYSIGFAHKKRIKNTPLV